MQNNYSKNIKSKNLLSMICLQLLFTASFYAQTQERPNIILIMADDMGFSDIGSFGGEVKTPNLDNLATNGLRFSQFYSAARCCPSRASLLTGLYPHMAGMGWMTGVDMREPGYPGDLSNNCVTIAEVLKTAGYATFATGKWHVSENVKYEGSKHNWPLQRGFDKYYGIIPGAANYFEPVGLTSGNKQVFASNEFYLTDAISDTATSYIRKHVAEKFKSPFFLYVAYNAPHWPLHAKKEDIQKYMKIYSKGWDKLREERYERQQKMSIIKPSTTLTARDSVVPAWKDIPRPERQLLIKRMAIYAAQIDCMDQGIGRIVETLKKNHIFNNTLILFISDNGGSAERISREDKSIDALGKKVSYESYRIQWANLSNTPFKRYKSSLHEGGIASPCIISWPQKIEGKGIIITTPAHLIDLMPTFLSVSASTYPTVYKGHEISPLPGKDLTGVFQGKKLSERPIFWEHEAYRALRFGKWKLVSKGKAKPPYTSNWELYDMSIDRSETNDLAAQFPEQVNKMEKMWNEWAALNQVFPLNGTNIPTRFKTFGRKKNGYHE